MAGRHLDAVIAQPVAPRRAGVSSAAGALTAGGSVFAPPPILCAIATNKPATPTISNTPMAITNPIKKRWFSGN